jgi:hypothetical protein
MRIAAISCAALVLVTGAASAATWHYGARAGVNLANVRGDIEELLTPDWHPGLAAGGFAEADVSPSTSIVLEVDYVQKGADYREIRTDAAGNFTEPNASLELSYVEVPILARLHLLKERAITPFIEVGPTFGFALGATQKSDSSPDVDLKDDLKTVDVGLALGVGFRFITQLGRVDFETRYGTGFGDLWDLTTPVTYPGPSSPGDVESINHGFQFSLSLSR